MPKIVYLKNRVKLKKLFPSKEFIRKILKKHKKLLKLVFYCAIKTNTLYLII